MIPDFKSLSDDEKQKVLEDGERYGLVFNDSTLLNPLAKIPEFLNDAPHLYIAWLMSRPEYLHTFVKQIIGVDLMPFQVVTLQTMWNHKFPMLIATRGGSKSFMLGLYALLRCMFIKNRKVIVVGAGFRQSKIIFDYIVGFWNRSSLLRNCYDPILDGPKNMIDMMKFTLGDGYVIAIPVGATGDTIRGLRANDTLTDEFSAINRDIFETVIIGFSSVKSQPAEEARRVARMEIQKKLGIEIEDSEDKGQRNQLVIAGTAYYKFNHFYEYWNIWRKTILSRGDEKKIREIFQDREVDPAFNWKDYCVIRLPYELIPRGFMDEQNIARAKATVTTGTFENEYCTVFSSDSNGFFPRSLIEHCSVSPTREEINLPSCGHAMFTASLFGSKDRKYVLGLDPASESANLAITIVELWHDHRRVVYTWTINRHEHIAKVKEKLVDENDYYCYIARKIRDLMKLFPIEKIAIDTQGGGVAIIEALHNKSNLKEGEIMIWPVINPDKPEPSDSEAGLHMIEKINFANSDWNNLANHGLKVDMQNRTLLFPYFDSDAVALAGLEDYLNNRKFDTLEGVLTEIEELKNELCNIILTKTNNGTDRWDTPAIVNEGKKIKMKKDRYCALLMANAVARKIMVDRNFENQTMRGTCDAPNNRNSYVGPDWLTSQLNSLYQ